MRSPSLYDLVEGSFSVGVLGIKVNGFAAQKIQEAHSVWAGVDLGLAYYQVDKSFV